MEPALFQFLIGVIGGSALGFALMRIRATIPLASPILYTFHPLPTRAKVEPVPEPVKTSLPQQVSASMILAIAQSPAQPLGISIGSSSKLEPRQETISYHECPGCGLKAPEKLMLEHFLGSPLHRNSAPAVQSTVLSSVSPECASPVEEEGDRTSLGDLLETLNVMERLLKQDFYRHELRVGSGISGRMANVSGWIS